MGGLPNEYSDNDVKSYMKDQGFHPKQVRLLMDQATQQSKGAAFIEFDTKDDAQDVCKALDGKTNAGRRFRVNMADSKR